MLQSKKASLVNSMTEIDSVMHEKLLPFSQETLEHEQEYQLLDSKRNDIAEKEVTNKLLPPCHAMLFILLTTVAYTG